ncbi:hypothetical protein C8R44DRAFT_752391 [Mycena epipterygia]|nr:hypothetical protein C8R44DRAFT_752391 [Mycena epipterygia]
MRRPEELPTANCRRSLSIFRQGAKDGRDRPKKECKSGGIRITRPGQKLVHDGRNFLGLQRTWFVLGPGCRLDVETKFPNEQEGRMKKIAAHADARDRDVIVVVEVPSFVALHLARKKVWVVDGSLGVLFDDFGDL